jgi:hypothetical protein
MVYVHGLPGSFIGGNLVIGKEGLSQLRGFLNDPSSTTVFINSPLTYVVSILFILAVLIKAATRRYTIGITSSEQLRYRAPPCMARLNPRQMKVKLQSTLVPIAASRQKPVL